MKYGIFYAYWEKEWKGDFITYIEKVKKLGFDILEVGCGDFHKQPDSYFHTLRDAAREYDIILTGGYGPRAEHNLCSPDTAVVENALAFYSDIFRKMEIAGIRSIGGGLYAYWPVDYSREPDKAGDLERSIKNMRRLADIAERHGITLNMEVLNRFEGYLINDTNEGLAYIRAVDKPNVKLMLDTFHMNIEEDSFTEPILQAGKYLGHVHVGEPNRKPPREGRIPWGEIGKALRQIGYDGPVVMEPFVTMGGQVGKDIRVWRDLSQGATEEDLDRDAEKSLAFLKGMFEA
ncbi:MAG TPA: sugar phosphate isomerase/epimerase family protein [Thermoclostridium caenicola]|uniref:D-psicose 3-epimerase n=1 Tax=Thermoclostridium caenicola TaxID=659425 RepID=UPI002BB252CA|nr:sugar phosphate isomerase/epimerase family protein [Thermoclostridium caenicola]HOK42644.1 sugar phosphate isomerase/epimerase family protein [Thermoclostridium caenicola]HOL84300.1 sugar phosphate isomerase/epimerase family protein [Thermoclostridium caenicola]HOP72265.1 sugar phosphate isomerase/epimerase family protein [Thermoclostridium caenicola]HPO75662.1 sugar phosphate isomerase/epimerase family protein [Thermoclostridium caenicola]